MHDYSPMEERVGEMVMVFPLGKLVYGYSPLGKRVGYMITPLLLLHYYMVSWSLPAGLHGHFSLGKLVFGYFLLGKLGFRVFPTAERVGAMVMVFPLGEKVGAWLLPDGGEGG